VSQEAGISLVSTASILFIVSLCRSLHGIKHDDDTKW